jgi:Kdo2-lipid IVA lauroyltransferase/acyltransferase
MDLGNGSRRAYWQAVSLPYNGGMERASRRRSLTRRLRHWLQRSWPVYALFHASVVLLDVLPLRVARAIGGFCGRLAFWIDRRHHAAFLQNIAIAFPEKSESERRAILKQSYVHLGVSAADVSRFRSLSAEQVRAWIVSEEGADARTREALALGRGTIAISGHIGHWELGGFAFPALGFPLVSVARRLEAPRVDALINSIRCRHGNTIIPQEGALRACFFALREKKCVGLVVDQHGGPHGPSVPFFGRAVSTYDIAARLHLLTGAPIVCHLMLRRPDGRYTWRCRRVELPSFSSEVPEDERIHRILAACNRELEAAIRETPEQWLWMHNRWKPKPHELAKAASVSVNAVELVAK